MKKPQKFKSTFLIPTIYSVGAFIILLFAVFNYTKFTKGQWEKDERSNLLDILTSKKSNLEKSIYSRIYYTRGVAAYVSLNPNISNDEFYELAKEYIKKDSVISSMALSKNCVINAIYPFEGHESAIGLDLLAHPERKEIVEKTIETKLTFVAGPVELIEGGSAFISYTPIFNKVNQEVNPFWGITDIVIKEPELIEEAGIAETENGFKFAIKGYNGKGNIGKAFWGDDTIFNNNPVLININLPIGNWVMAAVPVNGWDSYLDQDKTLISILFISSFIISILIWFISKSMLKIAQNEKNMKAIFESLDSLIIEYNGTGDYLKINYNNNNLLYKPEKDLIGKNIKDVFVPHQAATIQNAINKCLETKKLVVIEYPLIINSKEIWFSARITYKNSKTVILNAFDITEKKLKEDELHKLNSMKDQFFSIIAHDLKNPAGAQKAFIDLLVERFEEYDFEKQKSMLLTIQKSSNQLFNLLEDLLKWSMSQTGNIKAKKISFNFTEKFEELFSQLEAQSNLKEIKFINTLKTETNVLADPDLTAIILRNLVSNAIKFTQRKGEIQIYSEIETFEGTNYLKISIKDSGIGISPKQLSDLLNITKTQSNPGTENEKGSGLGLLLCKEFTEKQGGNLTVTSIEGKGSTFSFTLPVTD